MAGEQEAVETSIPARVALGLLITTYIGVFVHWTWTQHYGFSTFGFDLGIFEQGMWLLSRFKDPFVTVLGLDLFGDHTSFILVLLVPFYWVFDSTSTLLIAQTVALGGAALPVWLIGREKLRNEWLAVAGALVYLAHPAVGLTNLENFHPDSFEMPLVFGVLFFMMRKRWVGYTICLVALLMVKEDVALMTFVLGIYVAIRYNRRVGVLTSLASVAWFGSVLYLILPALNGSGTMDAWRVPAEQFGGPGGLIKSAFLRPWDVIAFGLSEGKPWYLWQMMIPLAGMFLLAPGLALVAVLPLLSNVMSTFWYQYHIGYHYGTLIVPVLVTAAVVGISLFRSIRTRSVLMGITMVFALVSGYLWGPIGRAPRSLADPTSARAGAIRSAMALIPSDADVSAAYFTVPHLTHREHIYEFPVPWQAQNWGDFTREGERLDARTRLIDYVLVEEPMEPRFQDIVDSLNQEGFRRFSVPKGSFSCTGKKDDGHAQATRSRRLRGCDLLGCRNGAVDSEAQPEVSRAPYRAHREGASHSCS